MPMPRNTEAKFWSKVDKNGLVPEHVPDLGPCWVWTGLLWETDGGRCLAYGRFVWDGQQRGTHRLAWAFTHGPIPKGMQVLHRCDVPRCVRPAHLRLGTQSDNMQDCYAKGRGRYSLRQIA